ncbi:surfactin family lipopeptide synthetase A/fengycin family lipopeptide synthetase D [Paenibacillus shirakamiensis]|uniref:Surfactin family lipopeptide synthetase A/fengycin family lipopeptide synthetase D n=1 Tax=Paenibacillus shirakamiensis TaxID=1265935 RepID=A0ABS4JGG3_9BACL|nr:non-ribosomal peptide synthetase [Paenibacillus shirakamiensis]MBP2000051.1 surfactin family lipopeptide synthetase A/fengycin family lipopeptide synthetase D [Paenibacillus shirakamiensis]
MRSIRNLSSVLLARKDDHAGIVFCESGQERYVSYGELLAKAQRMLHKLYEQGLTTGTFVVMQTEDNERFITLFWACILGGMIPVPITAARTDEGRKKLIAVCKQLEKPRLLCEAEFWPGIQSYALKNEETELLGLFERGNISFADLVADDATDLPDIAAYEAAESDIAFIQFTSGSTGDPKGVVLTHGNLLSNLRAIRHGAKSTDKDSSLSWLPLTHDMGLIGFHLTPLFCGMRQLHLPTSTFVLHPMKWLELTHKHRVTCLSSPNFGYVHFLQHWKPESAAAWDLSCVRLIFNGAEPISADHCRNFLNTMRPYGLKENCIFPVYGLAEASLAVTFPDTEENLTTIQLDRQSLTFGQPVTIAAAEDNTAIEIVELGFPVEECEVRICDEEGNLLPTDTVGLIQIKGQNVTKGYYKRPDVNKQLISPEGWLHTGDLGFMLEGRLYVTGRMKDVIFINGQNVYPHDLEALISQVQGAEMGKTAITAIQNTITKQDAIAVFIQHRGKTSGFVPLMIEVKKILNKSAGLDVAFVVPVRRIPKTTSGKIQRYVLAEALHEGDFLVTLSELAGLESAATTEWIPAESTDVLQLEQKAEPASEIEQQIISIWREVLKKEHIGRNDGFLEQGGNSLKAAYAVARLQETLGMELTLTELFLHETVSSLAEFIVDSMQKGKSNDATPPPVVKVEERVKYPASSAQMQLFLLEELNPGLLSYHLPFVIEMKGPLDLERFREAWEALIKRHPALRTSFFMEEDQVVQCIEEHVEMPLILIDGREWRDSEFESHERNFLRSFSLNEAPLLRMELVRKDQEAHVLLLDIHHIITDGTSMGILMSDLAALYDGNTLNPMSIHGGDMALWEATIGRGSWLDRQQLYWKEMFQDSVPSTVMPSLYPRPQAPTYRGAIVRFQLESDLSQSLRDLARQEGVTLYALLLSIYYVLLAKYTGEMDITVGTAAARRARPEIQGIVGMFVNMIPIRLQGQGNMRWNQWMKLVHGRILASIGHGDVPFEDIAELANVNREYGRNPLFDTVFTLQNMELPEWRSKDIIYTPKTLNHGFSKFDLLWECADHGDGISFTLEYALDLYDEQIPIQLIRHYMTLARKIVDQPHRLLEDVDLMDTVERNAIFQHSCSLAIPQRELSLHRLFELQVAETPQHIAVHMDTETFTYSELNARANRLAHGLVHRGVIPGTKIGLLLQRSPELIVTILAVLKAGAVYVPIDPHYPEERMLYMLQDTGAQAIVIMASAKEKISALAQGSLDIIEMDGLDSQWTVDSDHNLNIDGSAHDLAYIMYTSGSTGKPKGIMTSHRNVSRIATDTDYIHISEHDVVLQLSSYVFDGSTFDIYGALLNGAKLRLVREEEAADVMRLNELIQDEGITLFFVTTALFNTLVEHGLSSMHGLRHILFGGERASFPHVRKAFQALGPGVLLHVYGPTETTVFATCHRIMDIGNEQGRNSIPIGLPIARSTTLVMNNQGQMQPNWVAGELWIAGDGVASGYVNLPEQTKLKFLPHPFLEGATVYRTGDLVRRLPDGSLEFLDRIDSQVKLRGYRIELGEIENRLLECTGVRETFVMRVEHEGGPYLCAYIVTQQGESMAGIRSELADKLPAFMIPTAWVSLEKLPLNRNGKIDKNRLPAPERVVSYERPATRTERIVTDLWQDILRVKQVGVLDVFYEHGGHSLKAAALSSAVYKKCQVRIPLQDMYKLTTVRAQAAWIDQAVKELYEPIVEAPKAAYYPLSPSQQRMFLADHLTDIGITYHIPLVLKISGALNESVLEQSLHKLIERHEPLRTSYQWIDGAPAQIVQDSPLFIMQRTALAKKTLSEVSNEFFKPLNLNVAPLIHACYCYPDSDAADAVEAYLLLNIHHIAADGISVMLLLEDLTALIDGNELQRLTLHYKDYACWQNQHSDTERSKASQTFWVQQLQEPQDLLDMPLDKPRGERQTFAGNTHTFHIPSSLITRLNPISVQAGVSMNSMLFAAYTLLLKGMTHQSECTIGSLAAGRTHPDTDRMIGMFNQFLPIRMKVVDELSFLSFTQETHRRLLACYEHGEISFEQLMEAANYAHNPSRNPLFDTMLILHNQIEDETLEVGGDGWKMEILPVNHGTSKLDFKLDLYHDMDGGLRGELEYNTGLFLSGTMKRLAEKLVYILEQAAANPDLICGDVSITTPAETEAIHSWNDTDHVYPVDTTIHERFAESARRWPDRTAVKSAEGSLTYEQLHRRSDRMAVLLRSKGVTTETIVPIVAQRSLSLMVAIMAVLKAGGAYLPIDPQHPAERNHAILEDSGSRLMLVGAKWLDMLPAFNGEQLDLDMLVAATEMEVPLSEEESSMPQQGGPEHLAYVIYTSGSTGKPKGVMIEHRAVINRLNWMQVAYPLEAHDVILQKTPITFDVSVWELFWWSIAGASLYLLEPGGEKEPAVMVRTIEEQAITVMHFVPSMLNLFVPYVAERGKGHQLASLRYVFASGEALKPAHVSSFYELMERSNSPAQLVNLYGPTEATVDVSYYNCLDSSRALVPIGKPIHNIQLYIVDKYMNLQPIGVSGELCIAGVGLARGYYNRPDLTEQSFIPNPFAPGTKLYRTGDRARWLPDGNIEYLGRSDHQLKLRGLRIECGEIEQALLIQTAVRDAIVTTVIDPAGDMALCAYLVPVHGTDDLEQMIRSALQTQLPDYMIPLYFIIMDALPLTTSGKVDRSKLPQPQFFESAAEGEGLKGLTEQRLGELWREALGLSASELDSTVVLGREAHFFQMGGHSLRAAQLAGLIEQDYGVLFSMKDVFDAPVLKDMAAVIDHAESTSSSVLTQAESRPYYPLSLAQNRLFVLHQLYPNSTAYNLPLALSLKGPIHFERLQGAIQALMERHEPLRTWYDWEEGKPIQLVKEEISFELALHHVQAADDLNSLARAVIRPFDLRKAPLLRAFLATDGENQHTLMLDMHHIATDGVSMSVMARDFEQLYRGNTLEPLHIQYKDVAVWQQQWMASEARQRQEQYWKHQLAGPLPLLQLPTNYVRPLEQSFEGAKLVMQIPARLAEGIQVTAARWNVTPFHIWLAAYHTLLHLMTGQDDLIVGTPIAGRFHPAMESLVGMFVNTLPIRSRPSSELSFYAFVEQLKKTTITSMNNGLLPFEHMVTMLDVPRDASRNPLFDTMFVMQQDVPSLGEDTLHFEALVVDNHVSKLDLTFEVVDKGSQGAGLTIEYATALFKEERIHRLAEWYVRIIDSVLNEPMLPLGQISLLNPEAAREQSEAFNRTFAPYACEDTIEMYLERQATFTPHALAVVAEVGTLTYAELDQRSNRLAHALRKRGIEPDDCVAIWMDRSLEMMIAIYGVLKAGGAYVPIARDFPLERVRYMLDNFEAKLVLTKGKASEALERIGQCMDVHELLAQEQAIHPVEKMHNAHSLAYVLYTSGSTGQPKGVMIEHHSVVNRIGWMQHQFELDHNMVILQKTPITFDVSVWELFLWSFAGARLVLLSPGGEKDPVQILNTIAKHGVTTMHFVPSMLHLFLENPGLLREETRLESLNHVFTSGEALLTDQVLRFRERITVPFGTKLVNLYGPTEATVDVSYHDCTEDDGLTDSLSNQVPIGKPIDNIHIHILSDTMHVQPVGIAGELWISGVGLARGYRGRTDLTEEKFIPHPLAAGGRMYRTGDLARWRQDGTIEYLGRMDHQVKLRGQRIECGEIEHVLLGHPQITEVVVLKKVATSGSEYLCAYMTCNEYAGDQALREYAAQRLPEYMIPSLFIELTSLPLSSNGKIDRKALPEPELAVNTDTPWVEATSDIELAITAVWQDILQRNDFGIHHRFFDIGGESLLLIRVHQQLEALYPGALGVTDLFTYPTIASLANYLESRHRELAYWNWGGIALTDAFLPSGYAPERTGTIQFQLDPKVAKGMSELASFYAVSMSTAAYAVYLYFWRSESVDTMLVLPCISDNGLIVPNTIDFAEVSDLQGLVQQATMEKNVPESYSARQIRLQVQSSEATTLYPLYAGAVQHPFRDKEILLETFDMVLYVDGGTTLSGTDLPKMSGAWMYNARRVSKENMMHWASAYLELLSNVTEQFLATRRVISAD